MKHNSHIYKALLSLTSLLMLSLPAVAQAQSCDNMASSCPPAANCNIEMMMEIINCYSKTGNVSRSFEWLNPLIEDGNADAIYLTAQLLSGKNGMTPNPTASAYYMGLAAQRGQADAQYTLATMFEKGNNVDKNDDVAIQWYQLAADNNHAGAQNELGFRYLKGVGVTLDYVKAKSYFEKAVEKNHPAAMLNLGLMYEKGYGVSSDLEKALALYEKADALNYAPAKARVERVRNAMLSMNAPLIAVPDRPSNLPSGLSLPQKMIPPSNNSNNAGSSTVNTSTQQAQVPQTSSINQLVQTATQSTTIDLTGGDPSVPVFARNLPEPDKISDKYIALEIGRMFYFGRGVEIDRAKAEQYLIRAANLGHTDTMFELAQSYKNGIFGKLDDAASFKWMKAAAENGHAEAMAIIATYYEHGLYTQKNLESAVIWYDKAARAGSPSAQLRLANMFYDGDIIVQNKQAAQYWYQRAANQNIKEAVSKLQSQYNSDPNINEAIDSNDAQTLLELGNKYYKDSTTKDLNRAILYYEQAAKLNNVDAMMALTQIYRFEQKNDEKYLSYLQAAAKLNNINAITELAQCYENGNLVNNDISTAAQLYEQAAQLGSARAQFSLAKMYIEGKGRIQNTSQAHYWLIRAARQGDDQALNMMSLIQKV